MKTNVKITAWVLLMFSQQTYATPMQKYPLQVLVKQALEHQPSVAISYYETEKKQGDVQTAKSALYPTLDYTAGATGTKKGTADNEKNIENKVALGYRLTDFGVRDATIKKAEYEKDKTDNDYLKSQTLVAQEVSTTYLNINKYKEMLNGVVTEKTFYKKMLNHFSLLVSSGVALQSDLRKVQVSIDALNSREIMYSSMLDSELFKLRNITGMEIFAEQIETTMPFFINYQFIDDPEKLMQEVKGSSYDYKMLLSAKNAAMEDIKAAKSSYYPTMDINAEYINKNKLGHAPRENNENEAKISLNLNVNIFNGFKNSAQDMKVSAAHNQAKFHIEDFIFKTRYDINTLISQYHAANETHVVDKRAYENALQLSSLYEQEFQLGQKSLLELISSRGESFQSYISMIESQYSQYDAKLRQLALVFKLTHYLDMNKTSVLKREV
ncbi:TolC family protein (plasmid) [Candidatus Fukatsuia symbiotica]|uniref:ABC transporter n=1 Tax=Candidatus Fukatsuia symbiotica TaxID=1878942 RepID=A0A2U8I8Q1_9GAMM|nr:TolC family protein [Candidatus Fukatsuia symbiotica]AWK15541.1 ABC transporter [Candidatus Fukatsuia symbiotica]MEA9445932.1 TolC family protein [Candidatus Fukatsuia symbiotica]